MEQYIVELKGESPLLMHNDDIDWADKVNGWQKNPVNKDKSKAGDDRTPPWKWIGYLYHDGKVIVIPTDNIATCIMQGATEIKMDGGNRGKSYKQASRASLLMPDDAWPILIGDKRSIIQWDDIKELEKGNLKFSEHLDWVKTLGFTLSVKRARVGQSKHVRVRPRMDDWRISGIIQVDEEVISKETLEQILKYAGKKGLCDWRPSSPKSPGPWGRFTVSSVKK